MASESLAYGAMMRLTTSESSNAKLGSRTDPDFLPANLIKPHQFALNFSVDSTSFLHPEVMSQEERHRSENNWEEVITPGARQTFLGQNSKALHGLSGSPVWRIGASARPIKDWTPDASQLVGIVTEWNEAEKILIATSAAKLFDVAPEF